MSTLHPIQPAAGLTRRFLSSTYEGVMTPIRFTGRFLLSPVTSAYFAYKTHTLYSKVMRTSTSPFINTFFRKHSWIANIADDAGINDISKVAEYGAAKLLKDKVIFFGDKTTNIGIDLNPLHAVDKVNEVAPINEPQTDITLQNVVSPTQIAREIEKELTPSEVKKSEDKAKTDAKAILEPVIKNWGIAYWLLTSTMGIKLDQIKNQALVKVVFELKKKPHNNSFSLSKFKKILTENGIKPTFWQKAKLFISYYFFVSWISKIIISSVCKKTIEIIYEQLFGDNGGNQEQLLISGLDQITSFLSDRSKIIEEFNKNTTSTEKIEQFISNAKINPQDIDKLYKKFASTLIDNFLPSISKNIFQYNIDALARNAKITKKSPFIKKVIFFFVSLPLVTFYRILKLAGSLIDKPIKRIVKTMIEDIGPTIVENSIDSLSQDITQMNLRRTILKGLIEIKNAPDDKEWKLPFSAAKNSNIHIQLRKLAESISSLLSHYSAVESKNKKNKHIHKENPSLNSPNTILENAIQLFKQFGILQNYSPEQIISDSLLDLIPEGIISILSNHLHPKKFTSDVFNSLINVISDAFSPTPSYDDPCLINEHNRIKNELNKVIDEISTKSIEDSTKEMIKENIESHELFKHLAFPKVSKSEIPPEKLYDLQETINKSFVPRLRDDFMKLSINFMLDNISEIKHIIHGGMQIFVNLSKKK